MTNDRTTAVVECYLSELAALEEDAPAEPIVRELLGRSVNRLHLLCASILFRGYPRLTRPPMNLQTEEMLGSIVERLIKALREVRPQTARNFFALASQHIRWELNDLARRLDNQIITLELREPFHPASPESSGSQISSETQRILEAIDKLPDEEREVFNLVRIQGMTHKEVAELLDVSAKTIQRRLNRGLVLLAEQLPDLRPAGARPDSV